MATSYCVSSDGTDTGVGTMNSPFRTSGHALSRMVPGDTLALRCGDTFPPVAIENKPGNPGEKYYIRSYGSGPMPIISGFTTPSGWKVESKNIWSCHDSSFHTLNMLRIGTANQPKGRWPKSGYWPIASHTANTGITDNTNLPSAPWVIGGEMVSKKNKWILDTQRITDQTAGSITTAAASSYPYKSGYGYFFQNHIDCLSLPGDWCFDAEEKKVYLYSIVHPSTLNIRIANAPYSLYLNHSGYYDFESIDFVGSYDIGAFIRYSDHVDFRGCGFSYHGNTGFQTFISQHVTVDGCEASDINNIGFHIRDKSPNFTIQNSRLSRIAMIPGASGNGDKQAIGIKINNSEHNAVIRNNQLRDMGYIGIYYAGNNCLVEGNYAKGGCLVKSDGALYYTYGAYKGIQCNDNIGEDCVGNVEGTTGTAGDSAIFYLDDNARDISINRNYAKGGSYGFYLHNNQNVQATGNVAYDNRIACRLADDALGDDMALLDLQGNTWIAKAGQLVYEIRTTGSNVNFGTIDNNFIQSADPDAYRTRFKDRTILENISQWRDSTGNDLSSTTADFVEEDVIILVNPRGEDHTVQLDGIYQDLTGNQHKGTVTLRTNASRYLVRIQDLADEPEEVEIHLSVRIPGHIYRTLLAAVKNYQNPNNQ